MTHWQRLVTWTIAAAAMLAAPPLALAHLERDSYWPDPAPDTAVEPAAGGKVPEPRSLASAVRGDSDDVRVVCQQDSLERARRSIDFARTTGVRLRPTVPRDRLSRREAARLEGINEKLFRRCRYSEIQPAVTASRNNDRIVVMPGVYTEPTAASQPTNDPRCDQYEQESEKGTGAASYAYQYHCPNDQNLVAIMGRALTGQPDPPAGDDRTGIPNAGRCIRCNIQIEGSGARPDDVVLEGGDAKAGNGGPSGVGSTKDVGLRADRADGLVVRNMTFRHSYEHTVYVIETDGYLLDDVKFFYAGHYGALMFTSDHGLTSDCEGVGHGDSAVYPGSAADTGEQAEEARPRFNQEITRCDLHHNTLGYSGTMGNAVHVHHNNFWDNTTGAVTDSFFAGGHPGYPQDSALFEKNNFWGNNFNSFADDSDVTPRVPAAVGTGLWIAGGNNNTVRENRFWDNWRRGVMLIEVPDVVAERVGAKSTSHRNRFHDNVMGVAPDGTRRPNGVDFWWDDAHAQQDNCWYDNTGVDGTEGSATYDPPRPYMPEACDNVSVGAFYAARAPEIGGCAFQELVVGTREQGGTCPWYETPQPPGRRSGAGSPPAAPPTLPALRQQREFDPPDSCRLLGGSTLTCEPFRGRPSPAGRS
ncbi:MAG TPA: right-handed parallel beta-helix repeat-containing protein [Solirubrobacteraceae bacterium]|nr:right-handed parallel beta-helix repeat-containing protein [Solirubrobacteraceae bacterium]